MLQHGRPSFRLSLLTVLILFSLFASWTSRAPAAARRRSGFSFYGKLMREARPSCTAPQKSITRQLTSPVLLSDCRRQPVRVRPTGQQRLTSADLTIWKAIVDLSMGRFGPSLRKPSSIRLLLVSASNRRVEVGNGLSLIDALDGEATRQPEEQRALNELRKGIGALASFMEPRATRVFCSNSRSEPISDLTAENIEKFRGEGAPPALESFLVKEYALNRRGQPEVEVKVRSNGWTANDVNDWNLRVDLALGEPNPSFESSAVAYKLTSDSEWYRAEQTLAVLRSTVAEDENLSVLMESRPTSLLGSQASATSEAAFLAPSSPFRPRAVQLS